MSTTTYPLNSGDNPWSYRFVSHGFRGAIPKLIQFSLVRADGIYNLAFGDEDPDTGEMNDLSISDNGDIEKVLATVVDAIRDFVNAQPDAVMYFTGSTLSRTRLYRMAIAKYLLELTADFIILGLINEVWYDFEKDKNHEAFLAKMKNV